MMFASNSIEASNVPKIGAILFLKFVTQSCEVVLLSLDAKRGEKKKKDVTFSYKINIYSV